MLTEPKTQFWITPAGGQPLKYETDIDTFKSVF